MSQDTQDTFEGDPNYIDGYDVTMSNTTAEKRGKGDDGDEPASKYGMFTSATSDGEIDWRKYQSIRELDKMVDFFFEKYDREGSTFLDEHPRVVESIYGLIWPHIVDLGEYDEKADPGYATASYLRAAQAHRRAAVRDAAMNVDVKEVVVPFEKVEPPKDIDDDDSDDDFQRRRRLFRRPFRPYVSRYRYRATPAYRSRYRRTTYRRRATYPRRRRVYARRKYFPRKRTTRRRVRRRFRS